MKKVNTALLLLLMAPIYVFAFSGTDIDRMWYTGLGTENLAAGGEAYSSSCFDNNAIHWNSAGLAGVNNFEFELMQYNLYRSGIFYRTFNAAKNFKYTALGLSFVQMNTDEMIEYKLDSSNAEPITYGSFKVSSQVVKVALARKLSHFVFFGLNYNFVYNHLGEFSAAAKYLNGGVIITFNKKVNIGLNAENIVADSIKYTAGSEAIRPAARLVASVGTKLLGRWGIYAAAERYILTQKMEYSFGASANTLNFHNNAVLNVYAGFRRRTLSSGIGLKLKKWQLNYALLYHLNLGATNVLSVKYSM